MLSKLVRVKIIFNIEAPRVADNVPKINFEDIYYEEDPSLQDGIIENAFIVDEKIEQMRLLRLIINSTRFLQSSFEKADIMDVRFENCDLSNTNFSESTMHRVTFKNCKLLGIDFTKAYVKNVTFENCMLNLSSFIEPQLQKVKFANSSLQGANYYDCGLNNVEFHECDMNDIDFTQTSLAGIDLSTCLFEHMNLDRPENMKGSYVSTEQAIVFAAMYGLKIK